MLDFLKRRDVLIVLSTMAAASLVASQSRNMLYILGSVLIVLGGVLTKEYKHQPGLAKTLVVGIIALAGAVVFALQPSDDLLFVAGAAMFFLVTMALRLYTQQKRTNHA